MEQFFATEKTGRTHVTAAPPLRGSYEDAYARSEFIFAHFDHQLTGKSWVFYLKKLFEKICTLCNPRLL